MKRLCKNCKYWEKASFEDVAYECHTPDMVLGYCTMAGQIRKDCLSVAVCIGEGIYGSLITKDSFGCNLFEKK